MGMAVDFLKLKKNFPSIRSGIMPNSVAASNYASANNGEVASNHVLLGIRVQLTPKCVPSSGYYCRAKFGRSDSNGFQGSNIYMSPGPYHA